jgi:hypothetical protein
VLDDHASGDLVIAKDNPLAGRAEAPHAPERFPILKRVAAARAIV